MSAIILSQYLTKCHHRNDVDSQNLKIFLMKNIDLETKPYIHKQLFPFLEPTLQQQALQGLKMLSRMMANTYYSGFFMKTCKLCQSNCGDECLRQIGFISVQQNHRTSSKKDADDNVYEYVEMSKKTKIPDVKKQPIYDQDYKYPKYVVFCSKNSAEVDKKSKSPPNKNRQNSSEKSNNLPIVQQKFDESILNSQSLIDRRLSENSSEIISKFKNLIDYEQNYGHAYEDLYAAEHSYEYVGSNRSTRFHVQKIDEPKSKLNDDESKIQPDEHVYEALDTSRPSRFRITKVDESALRSHIYEPICVRPRWVDYLYVPPPHKRLPKKDCMGRVQWLNKPVRKKTSAGSISGRGLSTSNSRKMSDNTDSSNTSRKHSENFDSHIYENTEIRKPASEEVLSKDSLETRLEASKENNTESTEASITEGHSQVSLSKPEPLLIEQQTNKQTTDDLEANSNLENTDVEGMRTYEAVFL